MDDILRMVFVVSFSIATFIMTVNITSYERSAKYLKQDLEIAVHDASLQTNDTYLSEGKLVIDPVKAKDVFIHDFNLNSGLTSSDYKIDDFKIYDDSNTTFPVTFSNSNTQFTDIFTTPTVLVVIETTTNKFFLGAKGNLIRQVASYSYKPK